ncbi:hypothetical protein P0Y35_04985 [Kiritimatiellaeota bacterium B1221]|nr:hypothetical protein [Kiritimatiellaeota bacterium B1221]
MVPGFIIWLAVHLHEVFAENSEADWPWFEAGLSYANAKLPHALIVSGRMLSDQMLKDGLKALEWLCHEQTDEQRRFSPMDSNGFYPQNGSKARFDQKPLEAHFTVSACLEAFLATKKRHWLDQTLKAYRWFPGANKLGAPLYDAKTGGCRDGLHVDRLNQNQDA